VWRRLDGDGLCGDGLCAATARAAMACAAPSPFSPSLHSFLFTITAFLPFHHREAFSRRAKDLPFSLRAPAAFGGAIGAKTVIFPWCTD
jgi:hypothetical protein